MACATLKRPLDWDHRLNSPSSASTSKSSPSHRPNKRRCLFLDQAHVSPPKQPSPFGDLYSKYTIEEIESSIRDEMKKLKNRKQLNFTSVNRTTASTSSQLDTSTTGFSSNTSNFNNTSDDVGLLSPSRRDQPLFTFRQVGLICEKLVREREESIREEYERIVTLKLAEQYDTFVKFSLDQIQKSFDVSSTPSYLS